MRPSEGSGSIDVPVRAFSYDSGASGPELTRAVAVEAPIQIVIGGAPFAVMMATPNDLEDFAYGFALTEQIARKRSPISAASRLSSSKTAGSSRSHCPASDCRRILHVAGR